MENAWPEEDGQILDEAVMVEQMYPYEPSMATKIHIFQSNIVITIVLQDCCKVATIILKKADDDDNGRNNSKGSGISARPDS
jgi:hypothetical protein